MGLGLRVEGLRSRRQGLGFCKFKFWLWGLVSRPGMFGFSWVEGFRYGI
jgi:hypothetical protein